MWYLVFLILPFVLYPFLRFFLKRLCFFFKIKKVCKRKKIVFHKRLFSFFSNYKSTNADFFIETENDIFIVKLIGVFFKHNIINFIDETHLSVKVSGILKWSSENKVKQHPVYDFRHLIDDNSLYKNIHSIILVLPTPVSVFHRSISIGNGDKLGSSLFFTSSSFVEYIKNYE